MADRKISQLASLATPDASDYLPIVDISEPADNNKNKRITVEGLLRAAPDGTAASPGISFASDLDTGLYRVGANSVAISTNGTGRLFVTGNGNVGIGTNSPSSSLSVYGVQATDPSLVSITGPGTVVNLTNNSDVTALQTVFSLHRSGKANVSYGNQVNFNLGRYSQAGTVSNTQLTLRLTQGNANDPDTDVLTLRSDGRVGIGTTDPSYQGGQKLTIRSGSFAISNNTANGTNGEIRLIGTPDGVNYNWAGIRAISDVNVNQGILAFFASASNTSGESSTERMRIDTSGRLMIGTTSTTPSQNAIVADTSTGTLSVSHENGNFGTNFGSFYYNSTVIGSISQASASSVAYNTSSDYRLKENVVPLTDAIDRVNQLQVHRFNFIADPGRTVDGFIAHEAQEVVPECVTGEKDAVDDDGSPIYQGIDQSKLVPLLTAALQEAIAKIETLEAKVAALEAS